MTILDIGDSLGEDLGIGLVNILGMNPLVRVVSAAVGDTGVDRADYYDWTAHLAADLSQYHPQVVTVLVGGNDGQSLYQDGQWFSFGTPQWHRLYAHRVGVMMSETTATGARMLWVGLPIMQDPAFGAEMQILNSIYAAEAARHPGVAFFPTWKLFSNAEGQYSEYLTNAYGQTIEVRDSDGVHIAPPDGCDLVATAAVKRIEALWHVRLGI